MQTAPKGFPPGAARIKVIACATVIEEMLPLLPDGVAFERLDFGLHRVPTHLKKSLQEAIDSSSRDFDALILGYGLCSMAVVGLQARECPLVIPKVDDCIAIFLGSAKAYRDQLHNAPGTYFLTKGWIEVNDTILDEYQRSVEKYGQDRADRIIKKMLANYTRLVYINSGSGDPNRYRAYAQKVAGQFDLRFEEIIGSNTLIQKMLFGPWDSEFVVASPGQCISYPDFKTPGNPAVDCA